MKIAHVLPWVSRNAGGLFQSVSGLAKALAGMEETQVEVFGSRDEFSEEDRRHWQPLAVRTTRVVGPARLCYTPRMQEVLQAFAPDIIHSSSVWAYPAAVVNHVHALRRTPYVVSTRGCLHAWALRISHWKKAVALRIFQQKNFDNAACIHALNEPELLSIRQYGLKNPVCVIPNGIDLPESGKQKAANSKAEIGKAENGNWASGNKSEVVSGQWSAVGGLKAEGRKVLLYLGRVHPIKGLVNLIEAWGNVQRPEWVLAVAGWDEVGHEAQLLSLCAELGISVSRCYGRPACPDTDAPPHRRTASPVLDASVVFLGPQFGEARDACYRDCDAFILPSFSEGMPMAVLESWAYGKPVLMTPQCNLPAGFAAEAAIKIEANAESIAHELEGFFRSPQSALRALAANGRRLVAEKFAWPRIASEMKSVYDWILGGGPAPACIRCP